MKSTRLFPLAAVPALFCSCTHTQHIHLEGPTAESAGTSYAFGNRVVDVRTADGRSIMLRDVMVAGMFVAGFEPNGNAERRMPVQQVAEVRYNSSARGMLDEPCSAD